MIPKIYHKYPEQTTAFFEEFEPHSRFMANYWKSAGDNRHKRSVVEWNAIVKYANKETVKQASKKYYGIKPDGTKHYLSPRQIKKKTDEMKDFDEQLNEHQDAYLAGIMFLRMIIEQDLELLEEYNKKMLEKYDDDDSNGHTYTYYKAIHYDSNLYKTQKEEYKNGLRKSYDGRIECRIKESDIPLNFLMKLKKDK